MNLQKYAFFMIFFVITLVCHAKPNQNNKHKAIENSQKPTKAYSIKTISFEEPPYQYNKQDIASGFTIQTYQCILNKLNYGYEIDFLPINRAKQNFNSGQADAYLSSNSQEKKHTFKSAPIALEKWYWFGNIAFEELNQFSIIGIISGREHLNIIQNKTSRIQAITTNTEQLIKMFEHNRIDGFIANYPEISEHNFFLKQIKYNQFLQFSPRHILFNSEFINKNNQFIEQFNSNIDECNPISLQLNQSEIQKSRNKIQLLLANSKIIEQIKNSEQFINQRIHSQDKIKKLDNLWLSDTPSKEKLKLQQSILENNTSEILRALKKQHPAIKEIMLTNQVGELIASSNLTTDYFQGDEKKFTDISLHKNWSISKIHFDESTNTYLSHFSLLIQNASTSSVLIIGFDIQDILSNKKSPSN